MWMKEEETHHTPIPSTAEWGVGPASICKERLHASRIRTNVAQNITFVPELWARRDWRLICVSKMMQDEGAPPTALERFQSQFGRACNITWTKRPH